MPTLLGRDSRQTAPPVSSLLIHAHAIPAPRTPSPTSTAQCKDGRDEGPQHTVAQCNSRYAGCVERAGAKAGAKDAEEAEAIAQQEKKAQAKEAKLSSPK